MGNAHIRRKAMPALAELRLLDVDPQDYCTLCGKWVGNGRLTYCRDCAYEFQDRNEEAETVGYYCAPDDDEGDE
jgi:predicted amidophosphoribosyltransferase